MDWADIVACLVYAWAQLWFGWAGRLELEVVSGFAAKDGFDRVSTYGGGAIKLGEHRTLTATAIPYFRKSSSKHFTWYERNES